MEAKGIVLAVLDHSVDVVFLYLGIIRRLYLDVQSIYCLAPSETALLLKPFLPFIWYTLCRDCRWNN